MHNDAKFYKAHASLQCLLVCFRLPKDDPSTLESQSSTTMLSSVTSEADELDDEFNDVIAAIDSNEGDTLNFEIPENSHLKDLLAEIRFKTEHTEVHTRINSIISKLEQQNSRCLKFVKKVMFKMSTVIRLDMQQSGTIPENKLSKVFAKVHEYSTSLEYTMDCLALFEIGEEDGFEEAHVVVCYKILEYVREFMIEQKVSDLQPRGSKIMK
ncbi:MAG: hypothetical protein N0E48_11580, partial [Candidatus Thiodiazotropha endolucinida]|nr:hypothetical protein [Candidatus Thiodiazotropha taylori]MCW4343982.1 hypothetical protein [Candidatus Thiodiazotropha endolucinida]